ncbi:unnamed protein product, partial [Linum tenue]
MMRNWSLLSEEGGGGVQWLRLVWAIWLQAVIGTNSNFPAYSSELKHYLSLSQLHLNSLAFASDAGKLFGWVAALVARRAPLCLVLLLGSSLGFLSYGLQFLSITDHDDVVSSSSSFHHLFRSSNYPLFLLLNTLAGNSICWINTFCYNLVIRNFPFHQQVAIGITNSYQALTSKIYAVMVGELLSTVNGSLKSYLLLQSLLPLLVATVGSLLMLQGGGLNPTKQLARPVQSKRYRLRFVGLFVVTTATGVYAVFSSLCPKLWRIFSFSYSGVEDRSNYYLASRPALLVLLMGPMSASYFLLLNKSHTLLYISTATIGICSGAIISIAVSISSELFGPKHFGVNHNLVIANIPLGSLIFGYLAATVYESQKPMGHSKCMGMECYGRTFL